ncbi:hypothetical protein TNCV_3816351 [Trichonephila clavipes]|nr:hypothetical protein TNCV_3816351 [Trichonephila clavipes]
MNVKLRLIHALDVMGKQPSWCWDFSPGSAISHGWQPFEASAAVHSEEPTLYGIGTCWIWYTSTTGLDILVQFYDPHDHQILHCFPGGNLKKLVYSSLVTLQTDKVDRLHAVCTARFWNQCIHPFHYVLKSTSICTVGTVNICVYGYLRILVLMCSI